MIRTIKYSISGGWACDYRNVAQSVKIDKQQKQIFSNAAHALAQW